jgi:hypothetical protein
MTASFRVCEGSGQYAWLETSVMSIGLAYGQCRFCWRYLSCIGGIASLHSRPLLPGEIDTDEFNPFALEDACDDDD